MKLETFLGKFDLLVDAPDAAEALRELVLELAVRGAVSERLVSDQNDPNWHAFTSDIDKDDSDAATESLPPFEIPPAWRWTCLDQLGTTRVRNDIEDNTRVSFVPMALISSTYGVAAQSEERIWSEIRKGFTHFADGDVVMAKITPCFENAKSAVVRHLINGVGAGTTELHVFRRANDLVLPEFVLLYLKTRGFIARGEPRMTGSAGQKRVPRHYFSASPFPLPPPAEQKRIVAKVDELMTLCGRLEEQQQEREKHHAVLARASLARFADAPTPANLSFLFHPSYDTSPADLRKTILSLAVEGKLHRSDLKDEPAHEVKVGDVVHFLGGYAFESPWFQKTPGIRLVRNQNIGHGWLDWSDTEYLPEKMAAEYLRFSLHPGDLVLSLNRPFISTGLKLAWIREEDCPCLLVQRVACLRPDPSRLLPQFLFIWCNAPRFYRDAHIVPSSGVPYIATNRVAAMAMRLPSLAEQRRVVAKVDQVLCLVDKLETQLMESNSKVTSLLSSIVEELINPA